MTDQRSDTTNEAVINEALSVIDGALAKMMRRELVSSGEVADLLLGHGDAGEMRYAAYGIGVDSH